MMDSRYDPGAFRRLKITYETYNHDQTSSVLSLKIIWNVTYLIIVDNIVWVRLKLKKFFEVTENCEIFDRMKNF